MTGRVGRARGLLAGLLVASVLVACSGDSTMPESASAYLPVEVGGEKVVDDSSFARSIGESLATDGVAMEARAVGRPSADDPAPTSVVLAFAGEPDAVSATEARLTTGLAAGAEEADQAEAQGVTVHRSMVDQGGRSIALAHATPRDEVLLVVLDFDSDIERATDTLDLMLRAGIDGETRVEQ